MPKSAGSSLLKPGRKLSVSGRTYQVEGVIGQGGSGEVYKVRSDGKSFAIKVFFPFYQMNLFGVPSSVAPQTIKESLTFQKKEYQFLSSLSDPNIVRVYAAGEVELTQVESKHVPIKDISSLPLLVMELVDGEPVASAITNYHLTGQHVVHILVRLAHALRYLHEDRRYMHTDIKSANVLIRKSDREPILIDFALCKNLNFTEVSSDERTVLLGGQ